MKMRSWCKTFSTSTNNFTHGTPLIFTLQSYILFLIMSTADCLKFESDLMQVAEGNGQFAFELYKAVRNASPEGNVIISPFSITTCLALCYAGARQNTAKQIGDVMKLPTDITTVNKEFKKIISSLNNDKKIDSLTLNVANRIYVQEDGKFNPDYLSTLQEFYETQLGKANFKKEADASRVKINKWVQEVTKDKIKDLLPPDSLNSLTRAVLISAIYFKGDWETKFDPKNTREDDFYIGKDQKVKVPMMFLNKNFQFHWNRALKYQLLELPYLGGRISMFVLLPDDNEGLKLIEDTMKIEDLKASIQGLRSTKVRVTLPKFRIDHTAQLGTVLQSMGITDLFSEQLADLSGVTGDRDLFVSTAIHKAFLEVNEEGSEAAAATGMVMMMRAMVMEPEFRADHPFLVFIYDKETQLILFMGRVSNPK